MENQFQRQEKDLEARLAAADASITDKMRQFKESRECQILPIMDKDNAISDEEMIKFMAKEEMNKMNVAFNAYCLQCFDAVGWAAGRASGL